MNEDFMVVAHDPHAPLSATAGIASGSMYRRSAQAAAAPAPAPQVPASQVRPSGVVVAPPLEQVRASGVGRMPELPGQAQAAMQNAVAMANAASAGGSSAGAPMSAVPRRLLSMILHEVTFGEEGAAFFF